MESPRIFAAAAPEGKATSPDLDEIACAKLSVLGESVPSNNRVLEDQINCARSTRVDKNRITARFLAVANPQIAIRRKRKGGKGDGAGGGAVAISSPYKFGASEITKALPLASMSRGKSINSGPNRRYKNIWVPVERREYKI